MSDFNALKNVSSKQSIENLNKELEKLNNNNSKSDDRFWQPTVDKAGNGYAVIRFLPAPPGEDVPYVKVWDHGFDGPGGWYIENSLTTLGLPDPVSEFNSKLWNSTKDDESPARKQVRRQKRRLHFYSNIYVVENPSDPDSVGKVFVFKYGKKIFNKIQEAIVPPFDDQGRTPDDPGYNPTNAIDPFHLWEGAKLKLRIRNVEGYRNYDQSVFATPGPLANDVEMENIWKQEYSLKQFVAPENFKSYNELKERLLKVLGSETEESKSPVRKAVITADEETSSWEKDVKTTSVAKASSPDDEDDESFEFFNNLAKKHK